MSADNGYIIHERSDGKFVLQMYFASADEYPDIHDAGPKSTFDKLEDAVRGYYKLTKEPDFVCEYGLSISVIDKEELSSTT